MSHPGLVSGLIHLDDYNAITTVDPAVMRAALAYLDTEFDNPSKPHLRRAAARCGDASPQPARAAARRPASGDRVHRVCDKDRLPYRDRGSRRRV